jgi:acyl-[acyl-carrier-protein]-phospholipid O-acyltransferase/long-chain-fatty-acid--[acyl-carrier-protein] ligase
VQALATTSPDLPPVPGVHPQVGRDYEYQRLGTASILAGLDLHDGQVIARVERRHRSREFIGACNRPAVGPGGVRQPGIRPGSVGLPIPGVKAQVVDQQTGEGPLVDREGLLLVHGPNMMVGYLDQPERTSEVMRDGWYVTGDIARIDADGFIHITDRLSRFSKIGGEMVPHLKIEDAINDILGEVCCAVTAVPDDTRGERLVAFYTRRDVAPEALWDQLGDTELPKLWLPRRDNLVPIDEIPALGTGKTDLRRLKEMALALGAGR